MLLERGVRGMCVCGCLYVRIYVYARACACSYAYTLTLFLTLAPHPLQARDIARQQPLPNEWHPSDHLAVAASVTLRPIHVKVAQAPNPKGGQYVPTSKP